MPLSALPVALIGCIAIIAIGSRFLLAPRHATLAFGVAADNLRALTEIKDVRDITSGAVKPSGASGMNAIVRGGALSALRARREAVERRRPRRRRFSPYGFDQAPEQVRPRVLELESFNSAPPPSHRDPQGLAAIEGDEPSCQEPNHWKRPPESRTYVVAYDRAAPAR